MSTILPTPEEFFLKKGLYEKIELGKDSYATGQKILALEFFNAAIRTYCPDCKQESTFRTDLIKTDKLHTFTTPHVFKNSFSKGNTYTTAEEIDRWLTSDYLTVYAFHNRTFTIEFYCTHDHSHRIFYTFNIKGNVIQKIGQFPSIADSLDGEMKIYKKALEQELDKEKSQEFAKAIGLFSHGVGIGSFVYLRRIFEAFVFQAKNEVLKVGTLNDADFIGKRMADTIELLKDYLPEVIVEHKSLYSVVSKGIHELSEDECLEYFDIVKTGIELILDEKIAIRQAKEKREKFAKGLSKVHQEIKE